MMAGSWGGPRWGGGDSILEGRCSPGKACVILESRGGCLQVGGALGPKQTAPCGRSLGWSGKRLVGWWAGWGWRWEEMGQLSFLPAPSRGLLVPGGADGIYG